MTQLTPSTRAFKPSLGARLALLLIRGYQLTLSPFIGNQCRFHPSCSRYAQQAYRQHAFFKASLLSLKRLLRCHPFHPGGYDPVPTPQNSQEDYPRP